MLKEGVWKIGKVHLLSLFLSLFLHAHFFEERTALDVSEHLLLNQCDWKFVC